MENLLSIVGRRRLPGVIILDDSGNLRFMNETVSKIVPIIPRGTESETPTVPEKIRNVCIQVGISGVCDFSASADVFYCAQGSPYSIRAFPLGGASNQSSHQFIMILIEPIIERHQINYDAVRKEYGISKRELEVLKLICQGLNNREIAERLFISEHTAKDHVRSILRAFTAASRSEVIAALNH